MAKRNQWEFHLTAMPGYTDGLVHHDYFGPVKGAVWADPNMVNISLTGEVKDLTIEEVEQILYIIKDALSAARGEEQC